PHDVVDAARRPFPTRRSSDLAPVVKAALDPTDKSTALVQTQRDGPEQVEAVPVEPPSVLGIPQEAVPEDTHSGVAAPVEAEVKALRRLPFAPTAMLADRLLLRLLLGVAALVLQLLPGLDIRTHLVTREFVYAYVITRVVMAVVRLLLAPGDASLRIVQLNDLAAQQVHRWARRLVVLATFGVAFGNALAILGSGTEAQLVVIKATSLLVHLN